MSSLAGSPRRYLLAAVAIGGLLSALGLLLALPLNGRSAARPQLEAVFAAFDAQHPGRGADMGHAEIQDEAMAYALYASAALIADRPGEARTAARWLIENHGAPGRTGWGLPFAWDAFSDGSVNPPSTVYGITTALAVRALLDTYEATGDKTYAKVAEAALTDYATSATRTPNGLYFWYSDQPSDATEVPNVVSMLMGQYARAANLLHRDDFAQLAGAAFGELMAQRQLDGGLATWPYSVAKPAGRNDLVHASYVVQGLIDYGRWRHLQLDLAAELSYLRGYIHVGCITNMPEAPAPGTCAKPATLWGLGMLLYTLADAGDTRNAELVAARLEAYRFAPGRYGQHLGDHVFAPRAQAHLLFGLTRLARLEVRPAD